MAIDTTYRTTEAEIMDNFLLEGEELRVALDKIAGINKLLGGNTLTLRAVQHLLKSMDKTAMITIADIGCGNGDMLRLLADYGKKANLKFNFIGIDANQYTVDYAEKLSNKYDNITYECLDIFKPEFTVLQYDIVLCTLTLHHFNDSDIETILKQFYKNVTTGIIINDLHRSKLAYNLFSAIGTIFNLGSMAKQDGLISILRGFRKHELEAFSQKLGFKKYSITWRWAFRYEWIIYKT